MLIEAFAYTTNSGEAVLVVGHSNTVPMLLNAFVGEERYEWLGEQEYDALFAVSARAGAGGGHPAAFWTLNGQTHETFSAVL